MDEMEKSGDDVREIGHRYRLEPIATLSRLSRVNWAFHATINGSPKLQRALTGGLCAPPGFIESVPFIPPFLALKWLLQNALGEHLPAAGITMIVHRRGDVEYRRNHLKTFMRDSAKHPEASWRRVKAHTEPGSKKPLGVLIQFRRPNGYKGPNRYHDQIEIGNGATLGTFFESISLIVQRSGFEHVAKLELWTK